MNVIATRIPDVRIVEPKVFGDERGFFLESFNERAMLEIGIDAHFVQDNHSRSARNVLRGLHYQIDQPQGKLIRVTHGSVLDVAVDLRRGSPAFGRHLLLELNGESGEMLWIPEGFGHAFLVLSEVAGFFYKVTDYYSPAGERTIVWNDPDLAIPWPIAPESVIISDKDRAGSRLMDAEIFP